VIHLLRAAALLGISVLSVKLFATGQMALYMSPSLDPLTALTGVASGCLGLWELRAAVRRRAEHEPLSLDHALTVGLVLVPVALGLITTPRALDSSALGGQDLSRLVLAYPSPPGTSGVRPLTSAEAPDIFSFLRQAGGAGMGQQVRAVGMVAHSSSLQPGQFVLLRYSIVHCVADARPIGVLVLGDASAWQADEWVEVRGTLDVHEQDGEYLVALRASSLAATDEPANPYLPPI